MSWIDILWPMMGAASLTMGVIHLFIWIQTRRQLEHLLFFGAAAGIAALAIFELLGMRAAEPDHFATLLRYAHVPLAVTFISLVWIVRVRFRAGRVWLAAAITGTRLFLLIPNFVTGVNLNFSALDTMRRIELIGSDHMYAPIGTVNPWVMLGELSNVALVLFLLDAAREVWRRGDPRERVRALWVCGSMALFLLLSAGVAALINHGVLHIPYVVNVAFLGVMAGMSYDLGGEVLHSAQTARRLHETEQRFQVAVEAAPSAMLLVDGGGRIVLANAEAERVFGYGREALIGQDIELLVPETLRELHQGHRRRYHAEPATRSMGARRELAARRKDGTTVPVEIGLNPIESPEGAFVLASITDISERVRRDSEAAQLREQLTHLSRVATLGELSGSLAHDLNQPLTAILSNAQAALRLLRKGPAHVAEVLEVLEDIVADDKRAGEVIQRLRAMLKKESVPPRALDPNALVHEVLRLYRSDLLNRGIAIELALEPDLPEVQGDRVQLLQVLLNLLINACDAMVEQPGPQHIRIVSERGAEDTVRISVCDNGPGIVPERLERVFEPFFTTKKEGLGLGLAVCRTLVDAHHGRLWAENTPGRGACFRMELPVAAA